SSIANPIAASIPATGVYSPEQKQRAAAAVATALPLLGITFALAALSAWLANRFASGEEIAVGTWPRAIDAPRWALGASIMFLLLNIGLPIVSLLMRLHVKISPARIWNEFSPQVLGSIRVGAYALLVAAIAALSATVRWTRG